MLQPEPDASGQSRKTPAQETAKTAYICGIFRQGSTHQESLDITYKEGVAGSNSASPTYKSPANSGILYVRIEGGEAPTGLFAATSVRLCLRQHRFHRVVGGVLHVRKHVRVGVEGDSYREAWPSISETTFALGTGRYERE